jgi:hypothetical protein
MENETERLFVKRIRELEKRLSEVEKDRGYSRGNSLDFQVASLSEGLHDLETRVTAIEKSRFLARMVVIQLALAVVIFLLILLALTIWY